MNSTHAILKQYFNAIPYQIAKLKGDGSDRKISRVTANYNTAILVQSHNFAENDDFIFLTEILKQRGIPVPKIYCINEDHSEYLLEDLGPDNLADIIFKKDTNQSLIIEAYQKIIQYLVILQAPLNSKLRYFLKNRKMGYPLYKLDIEYFKSAFIDQYNFQHLISENINDELEKLLKSLDSIEHNCFVYRDFQSRNFMWVDSNPVFIDYQAAMLGSIYYDLGSMLYSSKSGLTLEMRDILIRFFYDEKQLKISFTKFSNLLYRFILLRRLRSLGSYGFLSSKGKSNFAGYIPLALKELILLFEQGDLAGFTNIRKLVECIQKDW